MLQAVRFNNFTLGELAGPLHALAVENRDELYRRYAPGTARRLGGDAMSAKIAIEAALYEDSASLLVNAPPVQTYAVVHRESPEGNDVVVGVATAMTGLGVNRLRLPILPAIVRELSLDWLRSPEDMGNVNVTGWTAPEHYGGLGQVYEALLGQVAVPERAWTIEPLRTTHVVHDAIMSAGFEPVGTARYELPVESGRVLPPISQAYVAVTAG